MAQQSDISSILAALAAQRQAPATTPNNPSPAAGGIHQNLASPPVPDSSPHKKLSSYNLPQPNNSGSFDLSNIKPVSTGSVNFIDISSEQKGYTPERGVGYNGSRISSDGRLRGIYKRSSSRSRSPSRRDHRDGFYPYRDDRRDDQKRAPLGRERSRSPPRGTQGNFSPFQGHGFGRDRSPPPRDDDGSEVIMIDSNLVGLIIGRQGESLRRIEQDSGTRIQFITNPEHNGPQRQCRISGNPRSRTDARREISRIIDENGSCASREATALRGPPSRQPKSGQPSLREGENNMQIMVPDRTVGLIIGRGGETIRDLQERSGCHINIVGPNKSVNGLRPVNLIGNSQAALRAKDLIMEIVESDTRSQDPTLAATGVVLNAQPSDGLSSGKISDVIHVPSEAVGMIIGKGGETIKEMQNATGCKINVSQASGSDIEREIGLVGSIRSIDAAKRAIWDKVDAVRERNGGGLGARGPRREDGDVYFHQQLGQSKPYSAHTQQPTSMASGPDASNTQDPYAAWGGYQNYLSLWYATLAQQQQQQQPQQEH